ncbi:uncharacterized protein LOC120633774 [Pararge aegeria]|uniref:uncharacterized protein LOC120633774 n=1 Tax=Pararge aegeria TaxID=116150 RepID=UPI0019D029B4|nr:uncharacterized protein LOC120633774 [Pararge aegeria]XP_039760051.1 uncharacterized protein LOC120633774 [Pararge aegeria]
MESSSNTGSTRQSRLLRRLLGKLRGEHRYTTLDKNFSFTSTGMSESIGCGSTNGDEEVDAPRAGLSSATIDDAQFAANIDLRYGGQYLTPEQLPEFCNQLHHLVEVIRNIQSYAKVTGEYPSELERRLEREAREVASLASETRNAQEAASRALLQRRALRAQKTELVAHIAKLRDSEVRELESSVRLSDRKLYKNWESLRDSTDSAAFEPLLEEVRNKQMALECLVRLIESRRANVSRTPVFRPLPASSNDDESSDQIGSVRKRHDSLRSNKRKRKEAFREPRSMPLSCEPSRHSPQQVTLFIQGAECTSRLGAGNTGAVALRPLEFPPRGSIRDILFFTTD